MTLDQFVKQSHEEIEEFAAFWRQRLAEKHEHYPKALPGLGEWFEQFLAWAESNGESR